MSVNEARAHREFEPRMVARCVSRHAVDVPKHCFVELVILFESRGGLSRTGLQGKTVNFIAEFIIQKGRKLKLVRGVATPLTSGRY